MPELTLLLLMVVAMLLMLTSLARASSDAAWADFRQEVQARCEDRARADKVPFARVVVDDFGTDSHGIALLVQNQATKVQVVTCLMDKRSKAVSLGSALTLPMIDTDARSQTNAVPWWRRWLER